MRVLLTGAAGSIGLETLKQLVKKKYEITVLDLFNKRNEKRLKPFQKIISIVYGSINNKHLISSLVKKNDIIIHLAAIIPPLADKNPELTREVNFYGTLNIVEAIRKQLKKPFLIYASSISVYGDRLKNPLISIDDPLKPSPGDYYAQTKIAAEQLIRNAKIPYTIFRLTGIMGKPEIDPLMFHMPLNTKIEIASNVDTGLAFANATEHLNELKGHIYNLGGGEKCRTTYRQFLKRMLEIYGFNFHDFRVSNFAKKDFHCGYYIDGHKLNDILHFQNDTLNTYYQRVQKETKKTIRFFSHLFSKIIIYFLEKNIKTAK